MKTIIKQLSFAAFMGLCSCNSGNASQTKSDVQQDTLKAFALPTVPPMLTQPELRADFLAKNYWQNFDFADSSYIHRPEITEQAWADYCDLLNHVPLATAQAAIRKTIALAEKEKKVYVHFTDLADKYLYDPNSPMRNEEFYIAVLEAMMASPVLNETEKIRPEARLALAMKNRKGNKATDFTYTLASGAQGRLYQIKTEYTVLFINNPGCQACIEGVAAVRNAPTIGKLQAEGKLKVLALYTDEELDEWENHRKDFPAEWINGYDKELKLKMENSYDLRAIPTLYLLDKNKTVILKDAPAEAIEEYLRLHP